ncbi:hypothetical protein [Streptomyces althioticus]|uniref:hypothetical protein n=1 Tax=Streptomyces althioticus TaxID=83380 RepID=UPI0036837F7D
MPEIPPLSHWPRDSRERHPAETALLDQWPNERLGPELAAIARAAQNTYRELLGLRLRRETAQQIREGLLSAEEWPAQYGPYERTQNYDNLCEMKQQRHEGMRHALLSGSENAVQGAITGTLRWLTADGK